MAKGKKYDYRVVQDDTSWTAEIIRQITSRETVVSKSQGGFASESEAQEWGENELKSFVLNLSERNKRRDKQRESKQRPEATVESGLESVSESEPESESE